MPKCASELTHTAAAEDGEADAASVTAENGKGGPGSASAVVADEQPPPGWVPAASQQLRLYSWVG